MEQATFWYLANGLPRRPCKPGNGIRYLWKNPLEGQTQRCIYPKVLWSKAIPVQRPLKNRLWDRGFWKTPVIDSIFGVSIPEARILPSRMDL